MRRVRSERSKRTLQCDGCHYKTVSGQRWKRKDRIYQHLLRCSVKRTLKRRATNKFAYCDSCNVGYHKPIPALWRHMLRSHLVTDAQEMHICHECNHQFLLKEDLRRHIYGHPHSPTHSHFQCFDCGWKTELKMRLRRHAIERHLGANAQPTCDLCQMRFYSDQGLWQHSKMCHQTVWYACNGCERNFNRRWVLANHIHRMHVQL